MLLTGLRIGRGSYVVPRFDGLPKLRQSSNESGNLRPPTGGFNSFGSSLNSRERDWATGSPENKRKNFWLYRDRSTLKRKRDYVILALLVGCALRRRELAHLDLRDPDGPIAQLAPEHLPTFAYRTKQPSIFEFCGGKPSVDALLDPERHRDRADAATLATHVGDHPTPFPHLDVRRAAISQADWSRALWRSRSSPDLRQCMVRRLVASEE